MSGEVRGRSGATGGLVQQEPLVFERSSAGRIGFSLPDFSPSDHGEHLAEPSLPAHLLRGEADGLPEVTEFDVVRHFTRLSQWNYSIETGMFPLGSCTMKYNPKLNERVAALPGFADGHPYLPEQFAQGVLCTLYELGELLKAVTGMPHCTLVPAAGAHAELTGMLMIRAYHKARGNRKTKVIVPESAHGTNPATAVQCGYEVVSVRVCAEGYLRAQDIEGVLDEGVAALMLTNPNTLGVFERDVVAIAEVLSRVDARLYLDGANLNALMGQALLGPMGVDAAHINLHKTFSTPHGGGGPGSGALVVSERLAPYLPFPRITKRADGYTLDEEPGESIGRIKGFLGHVTTALRAYTYIRTLGAPGIREASEAAILNANYLRERLRENYHVPYDYPCMHEVVLSDKRQKDAFGVTTLDIAKRLIDKGFHPPTIYFPLIVPGALMIEPTESESKETLDAFVRAMNEIAQEAAREPSAVKAAPTVAFRKRLDEATAARKPRLRWSP